MSMNYQELLEARNHHESWLREQPGVEGTGIGPDPDGKQCLKVYYLGQIGEETKRAIRSRLQAIPVCFADNKERAKAF